jgi:peroxiredoxin
VSPDAPEALAKMRQEMGLTFPLLSDSEAQTIRRWGILNQQLGGIPHPTAVVVDTKGVVQWVRIDVDYRQRPAPSELLEALGELSHE